MCSFHDSLAKDFVFIVSLLLVSTLTSAQKQLGDNCKGTNFENGKCVLLDDCPNAKKLIREKSDIPSACGSEEGQPTVCCETDSILSPKRAGDVAKKKCLDYYREIDAYVDSLGCCYGRGATGGEDASAREFIHMVALGYETLSGDITWGCGGSLISEKFVLTAAHCIYTQAGTVKFARAGDLNLKITTDDAKPQDFNVSRVIIHPDYISPSSYNDIALIELSSNAVFDNSYVKPACLYTETKIKEKLWLATGWGDTSFGGKQADHLQVVALREFALADCQRAYASQSKRKLSNGIDGKSQICAGDHRVDVCRGDSGGPLQFKRAASIRPGYYVFGVVGFGKACGLANIPSVYTRVSHYVEWIEKNVWPEEFLPDSSSIHDFIEDFFEF